MIGDLIIFIVGFIILIKGADLLVDGSSAIAKRYGIRELIIGLTIVSFGTSAPELVINVVASLNESPELAIGNILGSNIANIFLVLGVSAIIYPLTVHVNTIYREIPFMFAGSVIIFYLVSDGFFNSGEFVGLSRSDGFILLGFFALTMYFVFLNAKNNHNKTEKIIQGTIARNMVYLLLGIAGLALGSHWIVDSSVNIAEQLGISERVIGLSVVALVTSLPELAASAVAAAKRNTDLAIGNVVGSNIFNMLWILGVSSAIHPISVSSTSDVDFILNIIACGILFLALFVGRMHIIERWQGYVFLLAYASYIVFLIFRE